MAGLPAFDMEAEKSTHEGGWLKLERSSQIPKADARGRRHGNSVPMHEIERRQTQLSRGVSGISELAPRQSVNAGLALSLLRRDDSVEERGEISSSLRSSSNATMLGDGYKMALGINDEASKSAVNETMVLLSSPSLSILSLSHSLTLSLPHSHTPSLPHSPTHPLTRKHRNPTSLCLPKISPRPPSCRKPVRKHKSLPVTTMRV